MCFSAVLCGMLRRWAVVNSLGVRIGVATLREIVVFGFVGWAVVGLGRAMLRKLLRRVV